MGGMEQMTMNDLYQKMGGDNPDVLMAIAQYLPPGMDMEQFGMMTLDQVEMGMQEMGYSLDDLKNLMMENGVDMDMLMMHTGGYNGHEQMGGMPSPGGMMGGMEPAWMEGAKSMMMMFEQM